MERDPDTLITSLKCPRCGLINMRGQTRCGHCKEILPDIDELQGRIDTNPRLQQYMRALRRSRRRRKKIQKMIDILAGNAPRPGGFYVAISIVPGLGHILLGLTGRGFGILGIVIGFVIGIFFTYGTPMVWLALTAAALVHTYGVCDLMSYCPKNPFAVLGLTAGVWTLLASCFYFPIMILSGLIDRGIDPEEMARPITSGSLIGGSLLSMMLLCGAAFMTSLYYHAKSKPPNRFY